MLKVREATLKLKQAETKATLEEILQVFIILIIIDYSLRRE